MIFDLPLEELQKYLPARTEPNDFDDFWSKTLADARRYPLEAVFEPFKTAMKLVEVYDLTFRGFGGQPIKGWFMLPGTIQAPYPAWWNISGMAADAAIRWIGSCGPTSVMPCS